MIAKEEEFLIVAQLRRSLSGVCRHISTSTAADYQRLYERLVRTSQRPEDACSRADYYRRRAALIYVSALQARNALTARDKAARGSVELSTAMDEIMRISAVFEHYPPDPDRKRQSDGSPGVRWSDIKSAKEAEGGRVRSQSKRIGLDALVRRPGWQGALLDHISPIHRDALAVALVTGARPAEIAAGVHLRLTPDGLVLTIHGAKLGEHRGQPSRTLLVALDGAAAIHLANLAADGEVIVTTHPKRFSDAVTQAGRRAFPRMRGTVSPYSLRHAVASQLKASGIDQEGIALALGHRATRSQQVYGRACHGRQRTTILGVRASMPVKQTGTDPATARRRRSPSPRLR